MTDATTKPTIRIDARRSVAECTACRASRLGSRQVLEQWTRDHVCTGAPRRPVRELPAAIDGDWRASWHE